MKLYTRFSMKYIRNKEQGKRHSEAGSVVPGITEIQLVTKAGKGPSRRWSRKGGGGGGGG